MTKFEMFGFIANALSDNAEVVAFCNHEKDLLARKSSKSAPTKVQKENAVLCEQIVIFLEGINKPVTISEFQALVPSMAEFTNQKLSALFKKLVEGGKVVKTVDKKKSYFSVVAEG